MRQSINRACNRFNKFNINEIGSGLNSEFDLNKVNAFLYPNIEINEEILKKLKGSLIKN